MLAYFLLALYSFDHLLARTKKSCFILEEILKIHSKDKKFAENVKLEEINKVKDNIQF